MKNRIDAEELKQTMRAWITGVAIVTGHHNGVIHGMTANSFNSIALSPPTVLVALRTETRTGQLVKQGGIFAVSILDMCQIDLAKVFAGQVVTDLPRFNGVETFTLVTGAPLIKDAIGHLDCKVVNSFEVGGTTAFLGEVLEARSSNLEGEPLLYFNRRWRKLADDD